MNSTYEPAKGSRPVEIGGPSIQLMSPGDLKVEDHPRDGISTTVRVATDGQELRVLGVTLEAHTSEEITTGDLRSVRVVELIREHLPHHVAAHAFGWSFPPAPELAEVTRGTWPSTTAMSAVAQTYNFARALRLAPIKALTDGFGISRATAHRWVNLCKERGLVREAGAQVG